MMRNDFGVFEIIIFFIFDGKVVIFYNFKIKIFFEFLDGQWIDRLLVWIKYVIQDFFVLFVYDVWFWNFFVFERYFFKYQRFKRLESLRIYEVYVGILLLEFRVIIYKEFIKNMFLCIKSLGYNVIQFMVIMEYVYYVSFGYQVNNFFVVSSRYGLFEDLKELVDMVYSLGFVVFFDVVYSYVFKNVLDGLNEFDGIDYQYFYVGVKGKYEFWDSRLFNYGYYEVFRFFLSNLRFWMDEYYFDGFWFDGVISMFYFYYGIGM